MDMQSVLKELQATAIVMSGIESRQPAALQDHTERLIAHDRAMAEAREIGRRTEGP